MPTDRPDIGAVFDDHVAAEFVDMDLEATMTTMTDDPYVNHVPVMTGGVGLRGCAPVLRGPLHRQVAAGHRDHSGLADGR